MRDKFRPLCVSTMFSALSHSAVVMGHVTWAGVTVSCLGLVKRVLS